MKLKRILIVIMAMLIAMALFACDTGGNGNGTETDDEPDVPILDDLTDYSSETRYYNVSSVTYNNTDQQEALLQDRIDDREDDEDLSVPLKIFVNSSPGDIIDKMSQAGLSYEKMDLAVDYLAGAGEEPDLDQIVESGEWTDNDDWSFFDDWDYYDRLQERADSSTGTDDDADNVMRQRRKMMRQVYSIGMTGDEFGRLVIEQMNYAIAVTESMHLDGFSDLDYEDYVKQELSYDTLVYFKAFEDFSQNKSQTVQLYGYYYDYNFKVYDCTDDETFEKELEYSHMNIFSDSEWLDYLEIQRNNYVESYRYSSDFYRDFYEVHFQFQELLEDYDLEVYVIETAFSDTNLTYSAEMKRGMDAGFSKQLVLSDLLYLYSLDETKMRAYNAANTAYEQVKDNGAKPVRDEKEFLLNMEKVKIADYILTEMSDAELSAVLKYHIMSYSGDMIRNIQSEKKDVVLEEIKLEDYDPLEESDLINDSEIYIGRTNATISQLRRNYNEAGPNSQFTAARDTDWEEIRPEVTAVLEHDYTQYSDGTEKLEAFEDLLIKKKWVNPDGSDLEEGDDDALAREEYDTNHNISRFLNNHETVLRYSIGQVEVTLAGVPGENSSTQTAYDLSSKSDGTYQNGNNLDDTRTITEAPHDVEGIVPTNYPNTLDSMVFESGLTIEEAMAEDQEYENFLEGNENKVELDPQTSQGGTSGVPKEYSYEFEGWYIDIELKYKIDEDEKIKYDMLLYPGYKVTKD